MCSKSSLIIFAILCAGCRSQQLSRREGHLTVVAAGTVRSNSTYNVAVALSEFRRSAWLNISLVGEKLSVQQTVEVEPGTTKLVSLQVPKVNAIDGTLWVQGFGGITWNDVVRVQFRDLSYQVYIQTDKQLYKPGEVVRFRVICIDELTRPAVVSDSLDVLIYNSDRTLIKKVPNIELVQGVFKGELHLSEHTELGKWKIVVSSSNSDIKSSEFNVSRYSLPKFIAEIIGPSDVALSDDKLEFGVKATYAHEEPISGRLSVELIVQDLQSHRHYRRFVKSKPIDGVAKISLNYEDDLNINKNQGRFRSGRLYVLEVEARVEDNLTSEILRASKQIRIHSHRYSVEVEAPEGFDPSTLVEIKVSVKNLQNNPIRDSLNPVQIQVEGLATSEHAFNLIFERSATIGLDQNGVGVAHMNLTDENFQEFSLTAKYLEFTSSEHLLKKMPENNFQLDVLTESPEVGKEFIVQLKSKTPIDHFVYEVISRGNILLTERVKVPENATTHNLHFNATFIMVPKITIYVHRVKDEIFDSKLKDVYIKRSFKNSIQITAENEVKPGARVSINVTTDEGSYVGLMGIDERLLVRSEGTEDLTEDNVFTRLNDYNAIYVDESKRPGFAAGLVTLTNRRIQGFLEPTIDTRIEGEEEQFPDVGPDVNWPRLRHLFVDSWLFDDSKRTQGGGWQLHETCPDTITSWVITGFSLNPVTGLSLTRNTTKLDVFQPLYVTMDLPGSVKEGEIVEISVFVFNYLKENAMTAVTFESECGNVPIMDGEEETTAIKTTETLDLPKNGRVKLTFSVKPKKAGRFNLTVHAVSPLASDAVQKTLTVESEGIPHLYSKTYLVHFTEDGTEDDDISVNISTNSVQGSEKIELSLVGDIFGPLMESLKSLVRVPYGTGIETNTHFVSNLLVLKYLKTFNHPNPSLEAATMSHLEKGYQSLLTFKHLDGSFSLVNRTLERTGDALHTAVVLWGLQHARGFIEIDASVIDRGLRLLGSKYYSDGHGCFCTGNGLDVDATLTSLALLAFVANNATKDEHKDVIDNGSRYLLEAHDKLESPALVALSAYALIVANHEKSRELLSKLHSQVTGHGKKILLTHSDSLQSSLKITAENFLSLLRSHPRRTETLFPIVRALLGSKTSRQIPAHLLALDAMIGMASAMDFGTKSLSLHFKSDQGETANLSVNSTNVHVTQSIQLKSDTRSVKLRTSGKGFAVVNIKCRYNLLPAHAPSSSNYSTNVTVLARKGLVETLLVCVSDQQAEGASGFTAMEVNLPSGYAVLEHSLDSNYNDQVMSIQVNDKESSVFAIFRDVAQAWSCIKLQILKDFVVIGARPMSTVVYDFLNEDRKVTHLHEPALPGWVWS